MSTLSRRSFICGSAALAAVATVPAVAATGIKTLSNGKTEIDLATNTSLSSVGAVVELDIKKYGKVAVVRTSKSVKGFSVFNLSCPHAGVIVKQNNGGWACPPPRGHSSEFALNGSLKVGPAASGLKLIKFTATAKKLTIN
jgi:Rieske Fe-S protein